MPVVLQRNKEQRPCYQCSKVTWYLTMGFIYAATCLTSKLGFLMVLTMKQVQAPGASEQRGVSYGVLPLEFQLVDSQSLCVLQLLDLFHFLIVAPDLLVDDHLHTTTGGARWESGCAHHYLF